MQQCDRRCQNMMTMFVPLRLMQPLFDLVFESFGLVLDLGRLLSVTSRFRGDSPDNGPPCRAAIS